MKQIGLCVICGKPAQPTHTCTKCGMAICSEHFNFEVSQCAKCTHGAQSAKTSAL